jgi:hypothetical protein
MKRLIPLLLLGWATTSLAADAEKPKPTTVDVPGGAKIDIVAPAGWTVKEVQPNPLIPSATSLTSPNGDRSLMISFIPDANGALDTREKLEALLKLTAKQYEEGSVEKKTKFEKLDSKNGICVFAEFTDADLVGKKTEAGQFKVVGTGLMLIDKAVATVTVLGDSLTDKSYLAGKETIKTGIKVHK